MSEQLQPVPLRTTSYIARVDPRARIVAAVGLSIVVVAAKGFAVPGTALAAALVGLAFLLKNKLFLYQNHLQISLL